MRKTLALIPAALLLASCGANADEPQTVPPPTETVAPEPTFVAPEPITLDGRTFEYTTIDGAKGVLTIPATPEPAFHEFLTLTGQDADKTYAAVDVDNREGMAEYGVYEVNLYTPEGDLVTFSNLNNSMNDQGIEVPDDQLDAYYALPDYSGDVAIGQRTDDYVITNQPMPAEVSRIEVGQTGGGMVQVYPEVEPTTSGGTQQEWMDQQ